MTDSIDCACVIHGDKYDWQYVEKLNSMLKRNLSRPVRLHVFTERSRLVPGDMVKHELVDWPQAAGPKRGWWYKIQMFDPRHNLSRLLYFDLDVVITGNIDWIWDLKERYFWALKDFKYLWRPTWTGINSSVMLWDTKKYAWIWDHFLSNNLDTNFRRWHGDQDYLSSVLPQNDLRYIDPQRIKSYRWQVKDGGLDFKSRRYLTPGSITTIDINTNVLIFHGKPNPHEVEDPVIHTHWR